MPRYGSNPALTDADRARGYTPEQHRAAQRRRYQKRRLIILAAKDKPCADCGGRFPPYVMEFDHVRGDKRHNVSKLWGNVVGIAGVLAEIAKCDVVCSNCHRIRSWRQKIWEPARVARLALGLHG